MFGIVEGRSAFQGCESTTLCFELHAMFFARVYSYRLIHSSYREIFPFHCAVSVCHLVHEPIIPNLEQNRSDVILLTSSSLVHRVTFCT